MAERDNQASRDDDSADAGFLEELRASERRQPLDREGGGEDRGGGDADDGAAGQGPSSHEAAAADLAADQAAPSQDGIGPADGAQCHAQGMRQLALRWLSTPE